MNPWSRLQWVNKKLSDNAKERVRLVIERTNLRVILSKEIYGKGTEVTRREGEVLEVLVSNPLLTNKEIASKLCIAERTVKFHITSLLHKFEAENRAGLVLANQKDTEVVQ